MDQKKFEELLCQHKSAVERFVYYRLPSKADGDDVLQEVYLTAFRKFDTLKEEGAFKMWLLCIARNKCSDYFRKSAKVMEIPLEETLETALSYSRFGITETSIVRETLSSLADKDKQILYLFFFRNLPQSEIAEKLHIPIGTVKSRLYTAKRNFKDKYPYCTVVSKGECSMKKLPEFMPEYKIEKSEKEPFPVKFEELMGGFIIPKLGEKVSWAQYDLPDRNITNLYSSSVEKKVVLHGIEGVEIKNIHRKIGDGSDKENVFYFIAQLTEEYCRWLGNRYCENGVEHIITFLDGKEFLDAWGAGENNVGEPVNIVPRSVIIKNGENIITDKSSVTDCVGRYTVYLEGKIYDTNLLISIFQDGPLTEQYIDKSGRTVLWRRFNRDDWKREYYKKSWSEQLPENDRLTVNGTTYVHWYDCITDYIL